jgi:hypothetical protein
MNCENGAALDKLSQNKALVAERACNVEHVGLRARALQQVAIAHLYAAAVFRGHAHAHARGAGDGVTGFGGHSDPSFYFVLFHFRYLFVLRLVERRF